MALPTHFRTLARFPCLRSLELSQAMTRDLMDGMPLLHVELERLQITSIFFDTQTEADVQRLRDFLCTARVRQWDIGHDTPDCMRWTDDQVTQYVRELKVWEAVPGFRRRLLGPWVFEMARRRERLGI